MLWLLRFCVSCELYWRVPFIEKNYKMEMAVCLYLEALLCYHWSLKNALSNWCKQHTGADMLCKYFNFMNALFIILSNCPIIMAIKRKKKDPHHKKYEIKIIDLKCFSVRSRDLNIKRCILDRLYIPKFSKCSWIKD